MSRVEEEFKLSYSPRCATCCCASSYTGYNKIFGDEVYLRMVPHQYRGRNEVRAIPPEGSRSGEKLGKTRKTPFFSMLKTLPFNNQIF
jgi:hypothetical protein